jgi:3-deoxy-D-manno-octulosonic-acid transferase
MQSPEYARRMIDLGAAPERVTVTGSVKFDGVSMNRDESRLAALRSELGIGPYERVLLAGSTHAPEEQIVLDTYARLRSDIPDLRVLIAPRHQERFEEVARLIQAAGWQVRRRSESTSVAAGASPPVILLDTLGELSTCWGLAEVAFVGGSLSKRGGQNMLEACAIGAAVIVGPNTWNFRPAVELLTSVGGLATARDAEDLDHRIRMLLNDTESAISMRAAARRAIESQQGATALTVGLLLQDMPQPAAGTRGIAA